VGEPTGARDMRRLGPRASSIERRSASETLIPRCHVSPVENNNEARRFAVAVRGGTGGLVAGEGDGVFIAIGHNAPQSTGTRRGFVTRACSGPDPPIHCRISQLSCSMR
jgi:hypothetical protein